MPRKKRREYGVGSVYYDKSLQRWVGKYRSGTTGDGKPRYKKVYGQSREDAKAAMEKAVREATKMQPENVGGLTVGEYLTTWLQTVERAHLADSSFDRKEQTIRLDVIPNCGGIQVNQMTSDDVQAMITALKSDGKSLSTIKKAKEAISAAYAWGMNATPPKVSYNPAVGVQMPTKKTLPPKKITYYNLDEARNLCEAAYATWGNGARIYRLGGAVELLINTGLRLAEIVALEWDRDIDLTNKKITVSASTVHVRDYSPDATTRYVYKDQDTAKTASGTRTIPLNSCALHALADLWQYTGNTPYVLATEAGTPARERAVDRMIEAIGRRSGLPDDRLPSAHPLRHTFASLFLYGGGKGHRGDVKILSKILGHADVTTTYNVYVHILKDIEIQDLAQMPAVTGDSGPTVTVGVVQPVYPEISQDQSVDQMPATTTTTT